MINRSEKKAILFVSFGTGCAQTRAVTIDAIESDIRNAFPSCPVYTAWTSRVLIRQRKIQEQVTVDSVSQALNRMHQNGITDVIVQTSCLISGSEYEAVREDVVSFQGVFSSLLLCSPLLSDPDDLHAVADAVLQQFSSLSAHEALLLIGHGCSPHHPDIIKAGKCNPDQVYSDLESTFRQLCRQNILVGVMNSRFSLDEIQKKLSCIKPEKVFLAPLLITAGTHALTDLCGNDSGSWKSRLESLGFTVECVLKGLGEYPLIRRIFIRQIELTGNLKDCANP